MRPAKVSATTGPAGTRSTTGCSPVGSAGKSPRFLPIPHDNNDLRNRRIPRTQGFRINRNRCAVRLGLRMTRGLAEKHGLQLVAARGASAFPSILEISRRAHIPVSALVQLAKADAFRSLNLARREASWAIKALRDDTLPLFEDADRREQRIRPELTEPVVTLIPMTKGREVVEDYR